jgi:nitric oxide reductase activation protein
LREKKIQGNAPDFVSKTLKENANLVKEVRKQFQMLKPERFKRIPHLERGEEIDLNEVVEAAVDRRAGKSPSEKIYVERNLEDLVDQFVYRLMDILGLKTPLKRWGGPENLETE